ncbi:peroxiredoxin-like family protein [Maribacter chungangensis]|uniref:Peroxiredoxin-like family protein n=1 Tax=Maribacter chungangensis TaxID=1069117 RepID=A0ABW3B5W1_9FLAO
MIKPKTEVPDLTLPLINDTQWTLSEQRSDTFTMLIFYRGSHCPICKIYLEDLAKKLKEFSERGVHVIGISCDTEERAKKSGEDWNIPELPIGYNLSIATARDWGLFVSESISYKEPGQFSEPGLFLVRPDRTLYASSVQTMPFARPDWDDILNAIDYVGKNGFPARGGA